MVVRWCSVKYDMGSNLNDVVSDVNKRRATIMFYEYIDWIKLYTTFQLGEIEDHL